MVLTPRTIMKIMAIAAINRAHRPHCCHGMPSLMVQTPARLSSFPEFEAGAAGSLMGSPALRSVAVSETCGGPDARRSTCHGHQKVGTRGILPGVRLTALVGGSRPNAYSVRPRSATSVRLRRPRRVGPPISVRLYHQPLIGLYSHLNDAV